MKEQKYMTIDDLPPVIEAVHIQQFLNISKSKAYELMKSKQFHVIQIGRLFKAPKESFVKWYLGA